MISKKRIPNGKYRFYVHYVDCNRRLDEWVTEEQLDLSTVRVPHKVKKVAAAKPTTNLNLSNASNSSRINTNSENNTQIENSE